MSDVIRQLHTDHIHIARLLDLLEVQLGMFHEDGRPDYALMMDTMQYMTNYPDLFHHPKEDVVFHILMERDASTKPVVQDLLKMHQVLAEKGLQFLESLRTVVNELMVERETLESQGREYIALLRHHMDVEEGQVFPHAARILSQEDWRRIDGAVEAMEDPLFGHRVQSEYLALYDFIRQQSQ
jgi:hemerythrin-like domain-containing protein